MKLLMFRADRFWRGECVSTEGDELDSTSEDLSPAIVIFVHMEREDEERFDKILVKALKNIKWLANKSELSTVVLHSFVHLSSSKASPEFAKEFLTTLAERLKKADYDVTVTPFGHSCAWTLEVPSDASAKVFKEL